MTSQIFFRKNSQWCHCQILFSRKWNFSLSFRILYGFATIRFILWSDFRIFKGTKKTQILTQSRKGQSQNFKVTWTEKFSYSFLIHKFWNWTFTSTAAIWCDYNYLKIAWKQLENIFNTQRLKINSCPINGFFCLFLKKKKTCLLKVVFFAKNFLKNGDVSIT